MSKAMRTIASRSQQTSGTCSFFPVFNCFTYLLSFVECFGNNNTSYNGTFSSSSSHGSTVSAELLRVSTPSTLLSTLHPVLNTDVAPSSILQSLSSATVIRQDNGTKVELLECDSGSCHSCNSRVGEQRYPPDRGFFKLSKHVQ